ncbi:uncharacterized protein HMPREF1541_03456 [Cyphellophora europaea CBS 101466]|uniref:Uncharacterized protein n=1 Tax=Cyphellophora europaea (strain CBS 101466) TaxID=1220924 RepID=W2RYW4_CYPE1|nr:uncharacterized protein HMPREF1541_03456 [Cyphellophora europaea CBS 101466]ETN41520.1 hypothetical protein HMPREF1541_03456 [Cyphellophora europaea CBS 101466]
MRVIRMHSHRSRCSYVRRSFIRLGKTMPLAPGQSKWTLFDDT